MSNNINFHKTSNMLIEINKCWCSNCEGPFYELIGKELEQCPYCDYEFNDWPSTEDQPDKYHLIIDAVTGIPSIVEREGLGDE